MEMKASASMLERVMQVLCTLVTEDTPIYLVGGAVRDLLLDMPAHDLDFVMQGDVRRVARRTANALKGAFFMLDDERNTSRVILTIEKGKDFVLDFAGLRAPTLQDDLRARDFTINAMALPVWGQRNLIDPLNGAQDLRDRVLRMCAPQAFTQDPIRILRAIRLALHFQLQITPETWQAMQTSSAELPRTATERKRDEIFRMACGQRFASALRLLDQAGVLEQLFPEIVVLKDVTQAPPHVYGVWEHTLATLQNLERLFAVLVDARHEDDAANLFLGMAVTRLGRFRPRLAEHFSKELVKGRPLRGLVTLAALLHDSGKYGARQIDKDGRLRFFGHDDLGADLTAQRGNDLALSHDEVSRVQLIVAEHMRIHFLAKEPQPPGRRAVYRFFRDAGEAGIDVCLLSLADVLAVYGPELTVETWQAELQVVETMFATWWEQHEEVVRPPRLLGGKDLIALLDMQPGRQMGMLLADVEEAQACGQVTDHQQALDFAREWLGRNGSGGFQE
jgi:tRNA nucleotidyltransferase/poly(A) polymerase